MNELHEHSHSHDVSHAGESLDVIVQHILSHSVSEVLYLIPFLFVTYLAMEWLEHMTGGRTQEAIRRAGAAGPILGAFLGVVPQCGFSAAAAALYAGRVVTLGTLFAVFLSTSDEMLPIFIAEQVPVTTIAKILGAKIVIGMVMGFIVDAVLRLARRDEQKLRIHELCEQDHCACGGECATCTANPELVYGHHEDAAHHDHCSDDVCGHHHDDDHGCGHNHSHGHNHDHSHDHEHACAHDHAHDHAHEHGHDHACDDAHSHKHDHAHGHACAHDHDHASEGAHLRETACADDHQCCSNHGHALTTAVACHEYSCEEADCMGHNHDHTHDHGWKGIAKSALKHTVNVTLFIFVITLALNTALEVLGQDTLAHFLGSNAVLSVFASAVVALIPNCAASVVIVQLYLEGVLGAGAMMAGLLVSAGVGLMVLVRSNRPVRQNVYIVLALLATGMFWGLIITVLGVTF